MMDSVTPREKQTSEQTQSAESWKSVTRLAVGAGVFFLLRNVCGLPWFCALLMAFPAASLAGGIADGKPAAVFHGFLMLILAPFLIGPCKAFAARSGEWIPMVGSFPAVRMAVLGGISLAAYGGLFLFCKLFSKLTPIDHFPPKIQRVMSTGIHGCTLVLSVIFTWKGLFWLNENFLHYNGIRGFALLLCGLMAVLGGLQTFRIFRSGGVSGGAEAASSSGTKLAERPKVRLDDVAGMAQVKDQIRLRLIEPVRNPKLAEKYHLRAGGGVLLYGPPGTGKTFLARAVAGELDLPFYMISSSDVFSKYVGDSENNILRIFQEARKNKLSVIFIDEMETIFRKRTDAIHEATQKVISVILQEIDGVDQNKNPVLLLGATNMPWQIDEAFLRPGRFDVLAFVGLPDAPARRQILERAFQDGLPCENGMLDYMTGQTQGYSGADLNGVITKMRQRAFDQRASFYSSQLAYQVMVETPPASNREILSRIREWESSR